MKYILMMGFIVGAIAFMASCKKETATPTCDGSAPTYDTDIKAIIDGSCMGSSCHSLGSSRGDFTSYAGMQSVLTSGAFSKEVLEKQSMPQNSSLSQTQLTLMQCWKDNNFPEK